MQKKMKMVIKKIVNIPYKLKFIDSYRFMPASLSKHVDNLSNRLHNNKCVECKSGLDYMKDKDGILIFRCFKCKKKYKIDFDKELINKFSRTYDFCKGDINKFILLLRKGVYPYEYMKSFSETSLPDKKTFTVLLADIFENFRNMSLKIYELDPAYFVSLPGFAWHAFLK